MYTWSDGQQVKLCFPVNLVARVNSNNGRNALCFFFSLSMPCIKEHNGSSSWSPNPSDELSCLWAPYFSQIFRDKWPSNFSNHRPCIPQQWRSPIPRVQVGLLLSNGNADENDIRQRITWTFIRVLLLHLKKFTISLGVAILVRSARVESKVDNAADEGGWFLDGAWQQILMGVTKPSPNLIFWIAMGFVVGNPALCGSPHELYERRLLGDCLQETATRAMARQSNAELELPCNIFTLEVGLRPQWI